MNSQCQTHPDRDHISYSSYFTNELDRPATAALFDSVNLYLVTSDSYAIVTDVVVKHPVGVAQLVDEMEMETQVKVFQSF